MRIRKADLAGVAIAVLAAMAGTVSAAAASPAASPAIANATTLIFSVHFSPFEALSGPATKAARVWLSTAASHWRTALG